MTNNTGRRRAQQSGVPQPLRHTLRRGDDVGRGTVFGTEKGQSRVLLYIEMYGQTVTSFGKRVHL